MTISPDDPRWTDLLADELPPEEAANLEAAMAADPSLQTAFADLKNLRCALRDGLPADWKMLDSQRDAVLGEARNTPTQQRNVRRKRPAANHPWKTLTAAAAAVILIGLSAWLNWPGKPGTPAPLAKQPPAAPTTTSPSTAAGPDQPAPATPPALPPAIPESLPTGPLLAAEHPSLALPVQSGTGSLEAIRRSIQDERRLPAREAVRLEEMLNAIPLQPAGRVAVARLPEAPWHPDDRDAGLTRHGATLSTESLACPWKPSATLVLLSIRGNHRADCEVEAIFHPNPATVHSYRLLGFNSPVPTRNDAATQPRSRKIPARSGVLLCMEIEPRAPKGNLGSVEWSVDGIHAAPVQIDRHGDGEPSNDARMAALICAYAQWLGGQASSPLDRDVLAALAREIAAPNLPSAQAALVSLIAESLHL